MTLFLPFFSAFVMLFFSLPTHAQTAAETLSLEGATQTFNEPFDALPTWRRGATQVQASIKPLEDASFSWAPGYIWSHPPIGVKAEWPPSGKTFPAWTSNTNANTDPNGDMIAKIGARHSPLTWSAGALHFTAKPMPPELAATIDKTDPKDYMGASITSFPYAQRYGVFVMRAKLPKGKGIWPAFWLMPADKSWPPELDVMEVLGAEPTVLYNSLHWKDANGKKAQATKRYDTKVDLSTDFHEYAVDWGPETIRWYFDGKLTFSQPTPPELQQPCYIIANIAVGKANNWGGAPDAKTIFPATMEVDSIRVWQRPAYLKP